MGKTRIEVKGYGLIEVEEGLSLIDIFRNKGIDLAFDCDGMGLCGSCKVKFLYGAPVPLPKEKTALSQGLLNQGYRLACLHKAGPSMVIEIPSAKGEFEISHMISSKTPKRAGIAVDLGTTNIVIASVDMDTGDVAGIANTLNPQVRFGSDVISRIQACIEDKSVINTQRDMVANAVKGLISRLGLDHIPIEFISLCGNPTMTYLFLGLDPSPFATPPFELMYKGGEIVDGASILGINCPIYIFPLISAFVGGDTTSMIIDQDIDEYTGPGMLAIDIGTNSEIVLKRGNIFVCTSAAAGPAFEGRHIRYGMRAVTGAIERCSMTGGKIHIKVKGSLSPEGICGSGLIDIVAEGLKEGIISSRGVIHPRDRTNPLYAAKISEIDGMREISIFKDQRRDIILTQNDIRQLQLAKAAIRAGAEVLLKDAHVSSLDKVILAGAFGSYMRLKSLHAIGLFYQSWDTVSMVGDAPLKGAIKVLKDKNLLSRLKAIASTMKYMHLSERPCFQEYLIRLIDFPLARDREV